MSNYGYSYGSSSSRRPTSGSLSGSYSSYSTTSPSSSTTTYGTSYGLSRTSRVSTDVSKYTSSISDRTKTSTDYTSSLRSLNSSLNRLNLDSDRYSDHRTSTDRYSSSSSIFGSSSSSLTGRSARRLPPLESSSNGLSSSNVSSTLFPSSGSELKSSRSVRSSISSSRNVYDKYSSNYESNEQSGSIGSSAKKQGGLQNIGNSCYLNSVIQCLLHCDPIRDYFVNGKFKSEINSKSKTRGKCADATSSLFGDLLSGRTSSPSSVKSAVNKFSGLFRGTSQEDAQEFLRWYLEALHEDVQKVISKPRITKEAESAREAWSQYTSREDSQIVDLCVGQLKSSLTCSHCGYVSNVWDPFWDLSVPLPSGARNVEDCLEEFRKEETLDGSEKPKCERCKERRRMKKKFDVEKAPRVLAIHLKRFGDSLGYSRSKITRNISFQQNFRLGSRSYELRAVCNHSGGVGGGHYIAYGKTDAGWFEYNDSHVSKISESQLVSPNAYLLFYTAK